MITNSEKAQFVTEYDEAMNILFAVAPSFATLVQSIGIPVANDKVPTAQVGFHGPSKKILFQINPAFFRNLADTERAAIISHEAFHVLLDHLEEIQDPYYKDASVLRAVHECIINDGLFNNIGLELPDGGYSGPKEYGQDFSYFSTREGYDFLMQDKEEPESDESEDGGKSPEKSESSSGSGSSSGSDKSESSENDENEDDSEGDSDSGKSDSDENESDEGNGSQGGSGEDEDSEDEGGSGQGDDESNEDSEDDHEHGHCGGVVITDEDIDDFAEALTKAVKDAVAKIDVNELPDDLQNAIMNIDQSSDGWGLGGPNGFVAAPEIVDMNMNWYKLLQAINPEMKTSGRKKPETSWVRPNRRMTAVYPKVIVPTYVDEKPDHKKKGDSLPTIIVALDLSGSIPRSLVNTLLSLVDDIPEKFFNPIPVTWSDSVVPYDREKKILVSCGGTNIGAVYKYAEQIKKERGFDPYVHVITDGVCSFDYYSYGYQKMTVDKELLKDKWSWSAIQNRDHSTILKNFHDCVDPKKVYRLSDFTG